ncbi:hypothetical protein [Virgibacillus alimentarius]|uniref:Heme ABC transporter n=1 Tax=Virgibacillus alimentarius TaxID=698769 RepID=A0ABS4S6R9_9BACI|nr:MULTISPECIES: hypothetical protein [Virgibacillus]MBP2257204.1 hypothetical protein [Virgibacillus alimentarius]HLR67411.1 hypothetical protein [Virgibacillus sp.]
MVNDSGPSSEKNEVKENVEIWEDVVNIKDLLISLIISSITTLGGYLIAPDTPPKPLIFGLIGAIIGFIISSVIIKPKRTFQMMDEEK